MMSQLLPYRLIVWMLHSKVKNFEYMYFAPPSPPPKKKINTSI